MNLHSGWSHARLLWAAALAVSTIVWAWWLTTAAGGGSELVNGVNGQLVSLRGALEAKRRLGLTRNTDGPAERGMTLPFASWAMTPWTKRPRASGAFVCLVSPQI